MIFSDPVYAVCRGSIPLTIYAHIKGGGQPKDDVMTRVRAPKSDVIYEQPLTTVKMIRASPKTGLFFNRNSLNIQSFNDFNLTTLNVSTRTTGEFSSCPVRYLIACRERWNYIFEKI